MSGYAEDREGFAAEPDSIAMRQIKSRVDERHTDFQSDFPTAVGCSVDPIIVRRRGSERTAVSFGQEMCSEYMVDMQVGSEYLCDMPALQPDEVLYPGPFPPEVASRVNDYRAAAFLIGEEVAIGVVGVEAFGVQKHYAL